jgi:small subunit ribosomal protein S20
MVRTTVKALESSLKKGSVESPAEKFLKMQKVLDTAARKGLVAKNAASRKVSRMAKRLNAVQA